MKQTSTQACVRDSNGKPTAAQHWRKCSAKRPIFIPKLQTDTSHRSCAARTCNGWPDPKGARPNNYQTKAQQMARIAEGSRCYFINFAAYYARTTSLL